MCIICGCEDGKVSNQLSNFIHDEYKNLHFSQKTAALELSNTSETRLIEVKTNILAKNNITH